MRAEDLPLCGSTNRQLSVRRCHLMCLALLLLWPRGLPASPAGKGDAGCRMAVLESQVDAGQGFQKTFTRGLVFMLEPLRSGWIVRVLAAGEARGQHDYAELATPPYQSVSPILISTDWSFRAQDAVAWNPRRFRYAAGKAAFRALAALQPGVLSNDSGSMAKVAGLVAEQPEGTLRILETRIAPGLANQAMMASTVALHLSNTPYVADRSATPSPLGKIEMLRFRVELALLPGARAAPDVDEEPCVKQPTTHVAPASHGTSSRLPTR